jgi:YVTN family beta-propeller protein
MIVAVDKRSGPLVTRVFRSYFSSFSSFQSTAPTTLRTPLTGRAAAHIARRFRDRGGAIVACAVAAALVVACPHAAVAQVTAYAFVPNGSGPTKVTVIDSSTHTIVPSSISTVSSVLTAGASPDGRVVYLLDDGVTVVDVVTKTVIGTIPVGLAPWDVAFSPDGRKAYVVNGGSTASISIIDVATNSVSETIPFSGSPFPRNLVITPDGLMAYVSSNLGVFPVDLTTNTIGTVIPTGSSYGIALLPDGQTAFVAERGANVVRVVDLVSQDVLPTSIPVGTSPENMRLSPDGAFVYVANSSNPGSVSVIDVGTSGVVATVPVGNYPHNVAFTPDGLYAYVPNDDSNNVTVIAVATHTPHGAPIPVGGDPFALGGNFITPNILISTGGPLTIANDAALEAGGFRSFVPFNAGTLRLSADWTTTRHLSMLAGNGTLDTNGFNATIAGNVINTGVLTKTGTGTLTLSETSTSTHAGTNLVVGTLVVNGTHSGAVAMYNGSTLRGAGSVGDLTVVEGIVSPGDDDGIGILHATQALLGMGDTLIVDINGTTPGVDYDRLEVSGTATITNAQLAIQSLPQTLPPGAQFMILTNATGQFLNLPEGAVILAGSKIFRISYVGGDGNDVVLIHDVAPELTLSPQPTLNEDAGLVTIPFTVSDDVVDPSDVIVTVTSLADDALLPDANVSIVGTGASRAIVLTTLPNASGHAGISLAVSDGPNSFTYTFTLVINAVNDAPTITPVAPQSVPENMPLDPVTFTVADVESDAANLTVTATSSNQAIVPDANLVLGGSGATRTIAAMPLVGVRGETTITLTVSDGSASTSTTFTLTVAERTYYLAEGATGAFFDTDILLANPNATAAPVAIKFLKEDGTSIVQTRTLAATSQTTIRVDEVAGLEEASFSTIVTSTDALPIVVERTMRWDATGYGAHTEKATAGAASTWYFAEGAQGFFSTYFLLANPHATANTAHVTYFRENAPAIVRDYPLAAGSRKTIDAGADAELRDQAFGARVTFDLPGVAERAMYFGTEPLWLGGHASAGATAPASDWFLAEGATGTYFTTFVLIANPNDEAADVTLRYLLETGAEVTKTYTIAGGQRLTRNIALEDPALANAAVATHVQSTRPVVVERAQYWGQPAWIEAHNSFGITVVAPRWGLAEGRVGGADGAQTYILLANAGADPTDISITFLRTNGTTVVKTFTVPAATRFNVAIIPGGDSMVPELVDESFGARIESTLPIVVERSVYSNANGVTWAAGTNTTATRLP